jgi:hypothetical protein
MPFFRKKPVVIEAREFTGANGYDIMRWVHEGRPDAAQAIVFRGYSHDTLAIRTLEGTHTVSPGDWIIKGVKGEFYPCKPDIFAATYEPAGPAGV